jgi:sugar lactone lactonase YvrE
VARTSEKWFPGQNPILKADRKMFADCPGPPDASTFVAHGLDLQQQDTNRYRLYVTSHGKRESVEVFDIETAQSPPTIAWVGCVQLPKTAPANGVAILPDGGFMVTNTLDPSTPNGFAEMLTGKITGRMYEWHPGREVVAVEGTDLSGPNGIAISADGRTLYVTASGSRQVIRYELESRPLRKESSVPLAILPDDLHWTKTGTLYTAGRNYVPPTQCAGASCDTG